MNKQSKFYYKYLTLLVSILFVSLVYAITITEVITPTGTTSASSVLIEYNISAPEGLENITFSWDNVNYSLYDPSLVLFYNFNNVSALGENDTEVKDLSMYGNNGTVVGDENISWTPNGKYGGAFNFSGGRAYIQNNVTSFTFTNTTNETFSIWFNPNNYVTSEGLISLGNSSRDITFYISGTTSMHMHYWTSASSEMYQMLGTSCDTGMCYYKYNPDQWNNLVVVVTANNFKIYLNGVSITSNINGLTLNLYSSYQNIITIGSFPSKFYPMNGSIDDVMIWNRSLSSNEVLQIYNSNSNLIKNDVQNWTYQINQKLNGLSQNYQLCSSNSTTEICSSSKSIIGKILVNTNFTTPIGTVRSDFYGFGSYVNWFSENAVNLTGANPKVYANYEWNRQQFLNSGATFINNRAYMFSLFSNDTSEFDLKVNDTNQLRQLAEEVKWGSENGIMTMIQLIGLPTYLQNRTSGYCNSTGLGTYGGGWTSCPPNNFSAVNDMIISFLNNVTNYGQYKGLEIELGNENYGGGWCNNLSYDNLNKAVQYVLYYNSTREAIRGNFNLSYIKVIGPSGFRNAPNLTMTFLSNMTTNIDGIDTHAYGYYDKTYLEQYNDLTNLLFNCTFYGANCSYILVSEYDVGTINLKNTTSRFNEHSSSYGQTYISILNAYPSNTTVSMWQWSEFSNYTGGSQYWEKVVQPELVNPTYQQYKAGYNVTKSFAHLCPAGSTVYSSSSDDSTIKTVTCKDGNMRNIIVINTDTVSKNVTINLTNSGITTLKNYDNTSQTYLASGSTNVGILDSYGILYLGEDLQSPTITIQSPTASTYTTTNIDFNITLDEEGDTCIYSLNNFLTNYTMTKQGWVNEFKASQIVNIDNYNYTASFFCNDTSGNIATNSIEFRLDACPNNYFLANDGLSCTATAPQSICNDFFDAGTSFTGFIVILIIISIGGIVVVFLGMGDTDMDMVTLIAGTIIIGSIVLAIGMKIVYAINGC